MTAFVEIQDMHMPGLEVYAHLNENQLRHYYEPAPGLFIAESPNAVLRALDAEYEPLSMLLEKRYVSSETPAGEMSPNPEVNRILHRLSEQPVEIPVYLADISVLSEITGYHLTRGVLCAFHRRALPSVGEICGGRSRDSCGCNNRPGDSDSCESRPGDSDGCKSRPGDSDGCKNRPDDSDGCKSRPGDSDGGSVEDGHPDGRHEIGNGRSRIVLLENIENPTNVGAIIRSAAALGMDAVLLSPQCADPLQRRAIRVSVGTVFQIPWTYIGLPGRKNAEGPKSPAGTECVSRQELPDGHLTDDTPRGGADRIRELPGGHLVGDAPHGGADRIRELPGGHPMDDTPRGGADRIRELQSMGYAAAALALREDSIPIDDPRLRNEQKLVLVLGNEGEGLPQETAEACDYVVRIPMSHGVDSLNVAAAGAVAFWAVRAPEQSGQ